MSGNIRNRKIADNFYKHISRKKIFGLIQIGTVERIKKNAQIHKEKENLAEEFYSLKLMMYVKFIN